jgi:hypothetical protein
LYRFVAIGLLLISSRAALCSPQISEEWPEWADTLGETIVVTPESIHERRLELEGALSDIGYGRVVRDGEWTTYLAGPSWYPKVMLHDSGFMVIKRRGLHFTWPDIVDWGGLETPLEAAICIINPFACIRLEGLVTSRRRLRWKEQQVVDETRAAMIGFQDAIAAGALASRLGETRQRLLEIWEDNATERSYASRRLDIAGIWSEPLDNEWGAAIRHDVESFVEEVVQASEHPYLAEEIGAINESAPTGLSFLVD